MASGAGGFLRVRCKGKFCRSEQHPVVIHVFNVATGKYRTVKRGYQDPRVLLGEGIKKDELR
jgi:hypothetical protein